MCGVGKSRPTVVCMENTIISNNAKINSVSHIHNCKPTYAPPYTSAAHERSFLSPSEVHLWNSDTFRHWCTTERSKV